MDTERVIEYGGGPADKPTKTMPVATKILIVVAAVAVLVAGAFGGYLYGIPAVRQALKPSVTTPAQPKPSAYAAPGEPAVTSLFMQAMYVPDPARAMTYVTERCVGDAGSALCLTPEQYTSWNDNWKQWKMSYVFVGVTNIKDADKLNAPVTIAIYYTQGIRISDGKLSEGVVAIGVDSNGKISLIRWDFLT